MFGIPLAQEYFGVELIWRESEQIVRPIYSFINFFNFIFIALSA